MGNNTYRIAKNTIMLYFRQLLIMLVTLYTSRIVLATLGVSDFGVYNVIGGFVAMFSVVSGSMSGAISRFTTIAVGQENDKELQMIFSTSLIIQFVIAIVVVILCEIIGYWFLYNKMNIPSERIGAAFWVMQCSLFTFVFKLFSLPYNAIIIAHEKMSAYAYISILEVMLKLGVAFLLNISKYDKLIAYAFLLLFTSILIQIVYICYCKKKFRNECFFSFTFNRKLLSEMFTYIGWAFFGNGIVIIKDYGTNIFLNIFCGTVMNAARGIAVQVNSAANSFVTNFLMAVRPQITKNYANTNFLDMHNLILKAQKFSFFILFILFILIAPNSNYILSLWLKTVPPHTKDLVILIMLYSLVETFNNPLLTGVLAEGKIKAYELSITLIYSINVALSYYFLKIGKEVELIFLLNILFKIVVGITLLIFSRIKYYFSIKRFFRECVLPTACVFIICISSIFLIHSYGANKLRTLFLQSFINFCISCIVIILIGINKNEKKFIINTIRGKVKVLYGQYDRDNRNSC